VLPRIKKNYTYLAKQLLVAFRFLSSLRFRGYCNSIFRCRGNRNLSRRLNLFAWSTHGRRQRAVA